jgi:8-oxo-dGTP pyrophosphatase MutT (NUDIX family)/phosphohistidine phosphatase SixA
MNGNVIRAAGGVLWRSLSKDRNGDSMVEVAVIHRPRYDDWTLPKGKLAPGESEIEGAVREVWEETGYRVRMGRAIGEIRYMKRNSWGEERPKVVRYWAMHADAGQFITNNEVDELRWLPLDAAREILTHDRDKEILDKFVRGPALIRTVLLVRHAFAGNRSEWTGDDRLRPLDERGRRQAEALVRVLSRFEVREIFSADFVRCVQTVEPLADSLGIGIKEESLLSELGYPGHEEDAVDMIRHLGTPDAATVACTQGDVIPDLLARLSEQDHVDLPDPLPYKKGSTWVLSFDADRLFGADYIPPPRIDEPVAARPAL